MADAAGEAISMIRAYRRWRIRRHDANAAAILAEVDALEACGDMQGWARTRGDGVTKRERFARAVRRATYHRRMLGLEVPPARVVEGNE